MNAKQFRYVLVLAQEGSFSRAADVLNISQPSLSQYIKRIENEIGLALFDRTNGDVRLTDAGKVYIQTARQMMDLDHQMKVQFSDLAQNRTGTLIVGVTPYRAASMMPAIAAAFQKKYPGMYLTIREGASADLAEGLEHGDYDLALSLLPINKRIFSCEKVMEEELLLAVPSSFPPLPAKNADGRRFPAIEAAALNGQALVMLTDTQFMQKQLENLILDYHLAVRPAAVVKSLEAQIEMVKAGVGMALTPSGIERFCGGSAVTFYSFTDPLPKREVAILWRKDRKLSKVAEGLKDVIHAIPW